MRELRQYQNEVIEEIHKRIDSGQKKIGVELKTGLGKTVIAGSFLKDELAKGKRAMFVVPQINLAQQTSESFDFHAGPQVIYGGKKYESNSNLYVGTLQSLRRVSTIGHIDYIFIDEVHEGMTGKSIKQLQDLNSESVFIGLTATMYDAHGWNFDSHFDSVIRQYDTRWYLDNGYLCPINIYAPVQPNLKGVRTTAGDYNRSDLSNVMSESTLITQIGNKTLKYVQGKKTFVFSVTISHAELLAEEYRSLGIKAETYHSNSEDRPKLLQDFRDGKIDMLCSVMSLTKGVDVPAVDCLVIARPTKSESLWRQIVGRGMRPFDGKDVCDVIDCGNIVRRLGHPYDSPVPKEKIAKHNGLECPTCASSFVKLLSTKAMPAGARSAEAGQQIFEVIKTYECTRCSEVFRRVVETETTVCEECDTAIYKAETKIVETETAIDLISVCPECNHEKLYRSVPLVDSVLELFDGQTKNIDYKTKAQQIAMKLAERLDDTELNNVVNRLAQVLSSKENLKSVILERICDRVDTMTYSSIDLIIEAESFTQKDCTLIDGGTLDYTFNHTKDLDRLILAANEMYRRARPGYEAKKGRIVAIIEAFNQSSIDQPRLVKATRTKIENMYDRGHRMSSLLYFVGWLEDQDRINSLRSY